MKEWDDDGEAFSVSFAFPSSARPRTEREGGSRRSKFKKKARYLVEDEIAFLYMYLFNSFPSFSFSFLPKR